MTEQNRTSTQAQPQQMPRLSSGAAGRNVPPNAATANAEATAGGTKGKGSPYCPFQQRSHTGNKTRSSSVTKYATNLVPQEKFQQADLSGAKQR